MIRHDTEFAFVLEEAGHLLERGAQSDAQEHEEFLALLRRIATYRPTILTPATGPMAAERERLAHRLSDFEAKVMPHYGEHWQAMIGGDLRH